MPSSLPAPPKRGEFGDRTGVMDSISVCLPSQSATRLHRMNGAVLHVERLFETQS